MKFDRTLQALSEDEVTFTQRENAELTYSVNWGPQIAPATIATSIWEGRAVISNESNTTTVTQAALSASPGCYRVVNRITTSDGQTDERVILLTVESNNEYMSDYR